MFYIKQTTAMQESAGCQFNNKIMQNLINFKKKAINLWLI